MFRSHPARCCLLAPDHRLPFRPWQCLHAPRSDLARPP